MFVCIDVYTYIPKKRAEHVCFNLRPELLAQNHPDRNKKEVVKRQQNICIDRQKARKQHARLGDAPSLVNSDDIYSQFQITSHFEFSE